MDVNYACKAYINDMGFGGAGEGLELHIRKGNADEKVIFCRTVYGCDYLNWMHNDYGTLFSVQGRDDHPWRFIYCRETKLEGYQSTRTLEVSAQLPNQGPVRSYSCQAKSEVA